MEIDNSEKAGRNESRQYIYYFHYQSLVLPVDSKIKFEIGLRYSPICEPVKRKVRHEFVHPFTGEPLFDGGEVNCLQLKELMAEKLRAAATRVIIAPRDFYDIDFILRKGLDITDPEILKLFQRKLREDGFNTDLARYRVNLGRSDIEIKDMRHRIKEELLEVLTPGERKNFDLDSALRRINDAFKEIGKWNLTKG
jgi:predicted nucleotidyltransferase component of viral defense system